MSLTKYNAPDTVMLGMMKMVPEVVTTARHDVRAQKADCPHEMLAQLSCHKAPCGTMLMHANMQAPYSL
jgi:hypothetical protein